MSRLARLVRLPRAERRLLLLATVVLWGVAAGLRVLPFRAVRWLLNRMARAPGPGGRVARLPADRIAWAVTAAARRVPGARACLPQALAAEVFLVRHGHPARLRIGVARASGQRGRFTAHAWVEVEGHVVFGTPRSARYTPLPPFE